MESKRSKALKARWALVPKAERSALMSKRASEKNKQMSARQRIAHAKMMVQAKRDKENGIYLSSKTKQA